MTHSATAYRLLISAPGDVPRTDITRASEAVIRWNAIYGEQFGAVVVPTNWELHAAAEHGERPQATLNDQLVDDADIVIALFWHRIGTPTGEDASGTIEEINRAQQNGAHVAILRRSQDLPSDVDTDQLARLRQFYDEIRSDSLILDYANDGDLARHVDAILMRAVSRLSARAEVAVAEGAAGAEVWPRVESREQVKTDARGRVRTQRQLRLVLRNTGTEPARNVTYRLEAENETDALPMQLDDDSALEVLAPDTEASYGLILHMGVASQARCVVTWDDSAGSHENRATVRFV